MVLLLPKPIIDSYTDQESGVDSGPSNDINSWLDESSRTYGTPLNILRGVLNHESGLDTESAKRPDFGNGGGLSQALEDTARGYGTSQAELRANPRKAVDFTAKMLKDNADMFGGDYQKAAAAYFLGPGNVQQAEKEGGSNWLGALDKIAQKYGQGSASDYIKAATGGSGSQITPPSGNPPSGGVTGAFLGSAMNPDITKERRRRIQDSIDKEQQANSQIGMNTGDVPYAAGQDVVGESDASKAHRANQAVEDFANKPSIFSGVKDFATTDIPGADTARSAVETAFDTSVPGTKGILKPANLIPAFGEFNQAADTLRAGAGLLGINTPTGGQVIASQVPTTPLDIATSAPPGTFAKGAGVLSGIAKGARGAEEAGGAIRGAEGVLGIIGDAASVRKKAQQAKAQYDLLKAAGRTDEEIASMLGPQALDLAKGGTAAQRAVAAGTELTTEAQGSAARDAYARVLAATGDTGAATEAARKAAGAEAGATRGLRTKAQQLSDAMGNAAVEPKRTTWTITNAAGDAKKVETELPHGYQDAGENAMRRFEQNTADQQALNAGMSADSAAERARQAKAGVESLKEGSNLVEDVARQAPEGALELAAATNRELIGKDFPETVDEIGKVLSAESARIAATDAPTPQQEWWVTALKVARDAGDPVSTLRRMWQQSGGEPGSAATSGDSFKDAARAERAAQAAASAREADQAALAARDALRKVEGGGSEAVVQRARERAAAAADAAEQAHIASEAAQADQGLRAAADEARKAEPALQQREIEASQARVEAATLARNREEWIAKTRAAVEGSAAPGTLPAGATARDVVTYAERLRDARAAAKAAQEPGKLGSEIAGAMGAPRALALSADLGTARDLTLLGSSRTGFKPAAEGAVQGAKAFLSEEAAQTAQQTVKANPWHDFVTSKQNFDRPFHVYEYGEGVPSDLRVPEMSGLNKSKFSEAIGNLPWVKSSDRALAVQRNVAGMNLLERRGEELAQKLGPDTPEFYKEMQSTIDFVNHLRGYSGGSKARTLGFLNAFTSPQQMISRLQLVGDPLSFALRGDKESAKFAAENLLTFASSQTAMLTLLKLSGERAGGWSVNANPLSGDFGQLRIGNTRFDTLAGLGPIIKLTSRITAAGSDHFLGTSFVDDYAVNQAQVGTLIQRWLENKENPSSKIISDIILHNKLPDQKTAIGLVAPTLATGFMDSLATERGTLLQRAAKATGAAAANTAGIGTTSYTTDADKKAQVAQDMGLGDYNALDPLHKLPVLAQLPSDASTKAATPERLAYEAAANKAGYLPAPKDGETESEKRKREAANADVIATHPELDVQRWFYGSKTGGALHSLDGVDKALELGIKGRKVQYEGASRDLAESPDVTKAWQKYGNVIDAYAQRPKDQKYLEELAQWKYKKPYGELKASEQATVRGEASRSDKPEVEALRIFFGVESGTTNKTTGQTEYSLSSSATLAELEKLWREFPDAERLPKKNAKLTYARGAK